MVSGTLSITAICGADGYSTGGLCSDGIFSQYGQKVSVFTFIAPRVWMNAPFLPSYFTFIAPFVSRLLRQTRFYFTLIAPKFKDFPDFPWVIGLTDWIP